MMDIATMPAPKPATPWTNPPAEKAATTISSLDIDGLAVQSRTSAGMRTLA